MKICIKNVRWRIYIKIWNRKLPIEYIKENYKTPLSILAENKGKLKIRLNL